MQVVPFRDAIQPNQSAYRKYKQHKLYCNPFVLFHISIMFRFMVLLLFYGYLARKTLVHSLYMPPSDCKAQEVRLLHVLVGENSLLICSTSFSSVIVNSKVLSPSFMWQIWVWLTLLVFTVRLFSLINSPIVFIFLLYFYFFDKGTKNLEYTKIFLVILTEIFRRAK